MKTKLLLITSIIFQSIYSQTTILLQPDDIQGKDAFIDSRVVNNNYGNHIDFASIAWTNGGMYTSGRSLVEFNLSNIPAGSTINRAELSLYSYNSPYNGSHSNLSGSNESVLCRITSPWNENTVTWNNQPSYTTTNQVVLQGSTNNIQDYTNIDVKNLVQDMVDNPGSSYGFLLKLINENHYRRMIFGSSDNTNPALRPALKITFTPGLSAQSNWGQEPNDVFELYPNPAKDNLTLTLKNDDFNGIRYEIINMTGQIVKKETIIKLESDAKLNIDISYLPVGTYLFKTYIGNTFSCKKLIIK